MTPRQQLAVMRRRRQAILKRISDVDGFGSVAINGKMLWIYILLPHARELVEKRLLAQHQKYTTIVEF